MPTSSAKSPPDSTGLGPARLFHPRPATRGGVVVGFGAFASSQSVKRKATARNADLKAPAIIVCAATRFRPDLPADHSLPWTDNGIKEPPGSLRGPWPILSRSQNRRDLSVKLLMGRSMQWLLSAISARLTGSQGKRFAHNDQPRRGFTTKPRVAAPRRTLGKRFPLTAKRVRERPWGPLPPRCRDGVNSPYLPA